ncbi:MAG: PaaI family thioesterase [Parvibaculum sp.]|nr:PaaI family thioesterase [Parvibaculum sp.]
MTLIPIGFEPHSRKSPVTTPWEPLYARQREDALDIGFHLTEAHCNSRGGLHGGVTASLADNAMGLSYGIVRRQAYGDAPGAVTVSLSVDYVAVASIGQWISIHPHVLRAGRQMGFVEAIVLADNKIIARASATFRAVGACAA